MIRIKQECTRRNITRICHFTQSRNLAHIFADNFGILSRKTLEDQGMPYNPTDPSRYDGRNDLVCCSIEYPNAWYFENVRTRDVLFKDWVVLLIKPDFLWQRNTHFCPCNASREHGRYIGKGHGAFISLFTQTTPGHNYSRLSNHILAAPTNMQAEVLIPDPITLDAITGIVVETHEQARRELCRAKIQRISFDRPIITVPNFYNKIKLTQNIQNGRKIRGKIYNSNDE